MDIARLKKLSGASGEWKEIKSPAQPKSQATSAYNADTKNKSATDVRDVDSKSDINQDVAATMDSSTPEHTDTAKGQVEDQHHTISVDDNGAPKIDDETEVVTSQPDTIANESEGRGAAPEEGRGIITDGGDELFADKVQEAASCENEEESDDKEKSDEESDDDKEKSDDDKEKMDEAASCENEEDSDDEELSDEEAAAEEMKKQQVAEADDFDNEDTIEESAGDIGRFQKSMSVFKDMYKVSEEEARQIIYALRGGASRAAAKAMSKIFPSAAITNKEQLQQAASDLFDKHPELQRELMEKVETKFETEYRSLKEYFKEARS